MNWNSDLRVKYSNPITIKPYYVYTPVKVNANSTNTFKAYIGSIRKFVTKRFNYNKYAEFNNFLASYKKV